MDMSHTSQLTLFLFTKNPFASQKHLQNLNEEMKKKYGERE
ncbi:hypothetical protein C5S29_08760 [ANME-1 cluster archaeon GoMg3.2]|nr:hypothetical protein [ANME-1 cluster archaeon GoMg3.2]